MTHAFAAMPRGGIDLLTVDLMFTVLELAAHENPRHYKAELYRHFGRHPDDSSEDSAGDPLRMTDDEVMTLVDELRHRFRGIHGDSDFWLIVNQFWFKQVLEKDGRRHQHSMRYATRVRDTLLRRRTMYEVRPEMIDLMRSVRQTGARVVILSNQIDAVAREHVNSFGIEGEFDAVYTSEELGWMKPHREIWDEVLRRESEVVGRPISPNNCAHLGNSANSDSGAAELGIHVLLYDRYENLNALRDFRVDGVSLPQQDPEKLIHWCKSGLITVHNTVDSIGQQISKLACDNANS